MRIIFYTSCFFLIACGEQTNDSSNHLMDGTDSIKELEMSEPRLNAVDFNNEMTFMQDAILKQVDELFGSDSSNVDVNLENTLFELELNLESLANMKAPEKAEAFVTAMQNLMIFYRDELTGPFQEIIPLLKKADWSKADEKKVNDYDIRFVAAEKQWFDTVFAEQEKFAAAHNIKLEQEY